MDELQVYVIQHKIDIIGIAETWLSDKNPVSEVNIPGYKLYAKTCWQLAKGCKENCVVIRWN